MTWHPLATNPLPEPKEGQWLLIRCRAEPLYMFDCKGPSGGSHWERDPVELRADWLKYDPDAQWFLVPAPGEPSEADELRKRVAELEDLVSRAIRCSRRVTSLKVPRWTCVKRVFSVGSTRAHELCRRFGLDPDEKVGGAS